MRLLLCAVVALAGCAQLFGLDQTTGGSGASLNLQRVSIGSSIVTSPLDVTSETATFYVPDKTDPTVLVPVPGVQSAIDTWTADVQAVPIVEFTLPDLPMRQNHLWELPVAQVKGPFYAFEHPNPLPAPMATQEMLSVTLPSASVAGESFEVQAIGAWTRHSLTAAEAPVPPAATITTTIAYSAFTPSTNSPAYRIAASDTVVVLRYMGALLTGVYQTAFDQSDTMDTITGTMVAVTANQMVQSAIDPNMLATRYTVARPAVGGLAMAWSISAAPGAQQATALGPQLNAGAVAMTDTMLMTTFGNPFESLGWHALISVSSQEGRTFTFMAMPVGLSATASLVADTSASPTFDFKAPMPEQVNIDDNQLTTDGQTLTLAPGVAHTVKVLTENKPASLYQLDLVDLSITGGVLTRTTVFQAVATQPLFTIPPLVLQSQHTYIPVVGTIAGDFPSAATGDLTARSLPVARASYDGGVFTVGP